MVSDYGEGADRVVAEDRRGRILTALAQHNYLSVQEIARRFDCSVATARRDVQVLATAGLIQRSHGGALASPPPASLSPDAYPEEPDPLLDAKQRIARAAAAMV